MGLIKLFDIVAKADKNDTTANCSSNNLEEKLNECINSLELAIIQLDYSIANISRGKNPVAEKHSSSFSKTKHWQQESKLNLLVEDKIRSTTELLSKCHCGKNVAPVFTKTNINFSKKTVSNEQRKLIALKAELADCKLLQAKCRNDRAKKKLQEITKKIDTTRLVNSNVCIEDQVTELKTESQLAIDFSSTILKQQSARLESNSRFVR